MKNTIKTITIATIVTIVIMLSCAFAMPASAEDERKEFYPKLTIVVDTEQASAELWIITCEDRTGNLWAFYDDAGEWNVGDIANLLMWNVGEREEEDEIIEVYWEGYTDNLKIFFQTIAWHQ